MCPKISDNPNCLSTTLIIALFCVLSTVNPVYILCNNQNFRSSIKVQTQNLRFSVNLRQYSGHNLILNMKVALALLIFVVTVLFDSSLSESINSDGDINDKMDQQNHFLNQIQSKFWMHFGPCNYYECRRYCNKRGYCNANRKCVCY